MNIIRKLLGKLLYSITKALSAIMGTLIQGTESLVLFVKSITKGCFALLSMGGCLLFIFFATWGLRILADPIGLAFVLTLLLFPILGARFVAFMKYQKYIITEFLFNLSNHLIDGKKYQYKPFSEYKMAYKNAEQERIREEQRRYYEQQREWGERFKQQWQQQHSQGQGSQGNYGSYGGQGNYGQGFMNSTVDFKNKYEKSCDTLGVPYNVHKDQVKLAYRRKAKEFHPDLSKAPNATKMFQEITDANQFLNDENIQRYKNYL
ncbi:DnaJ domain-containing protein [Alkalicella caledoniensis]|uniref:DnaJ domain-containing protein n=1 Tax=Alkalicella caledoniensis TaxID=2731377 RepID=A0A7G9W9Q6_ALKCA|nr:DnaJ domain-containing protein [Alkalicella caledoniensis]QNO15418.1 DnaJ domain-containing protein [Alkalicella caledoniensis]